MLFYFVLGLSQNELRTEIRYVVSEIMIVETPKSFRILRKWETRIGFVRIGRFYSV